VTAPPLKQVGKELKGLSSSLVWTHTSQSREPLSAKEWLSKEAPFIYQAVRPQTYCLVSQITISESSFSSNYASLTGGAIYGQGFSLISISSTTFDSNIAKTSGGDIYGLFSDYSIELDDVTFTNSDSTTALYLDTVGLKATGVTISGTCRV